jgi:hypothetical protein
MACHLGKRHTSNSPCPHSAPTHQHQHNIISSSTSMPWQLNSSHLPQPPRYTCRAAAADTCPAAAAEVVEAAEAAADTQSRDLSQLPEYACGPADRRHTAAGGQVVSNVLHVNNDRTGQGYKGKANKARQHIA